MDKITVIYDTTGNTLTVWFDDPAKEHICEETADEVVLMKDAAGKVIGFEMLHFHPGDTESALAVETVVQSGA